MDARTSRYHEVYARALRDPDGFWAEAAQAIDWYEPARKVFDKDADVYGRWFTGASCNTCYNAIDRHVERGRGAQAAIIYDSPVTQTKRVITYAELLREVSTLAAMLQGVQFSPLMFLLVVNVILLILGCFLEGTTIILIIVPVLLPTAQALGIDPVHFGVVAVVNIMLGLITPPYGLLLFLMVKIAEVPLKDLVRDVMPFLGAMVVVLALITTFPDLVLYLPRLLGYTD